MAVIEVRVMHAMDAEKSSKLLRKIVSYRIVVSDQNDGPDVITAAASVPKADLSAYVNPFKYGNDSANPQLICRGISGLTKSVKWNGSFSVWQLDAEFLFDRDQTRVEKGVTVRPITRVDNQLIDIAKFRGVYKPAAVGDLVINGQFELDAAITDETSPVLKIDKLTPITNSAGTPVIPAIEQPMGHGGLVVSWTRYTPINYAPFINSVNSNSVFISDTHGAYAENFAPGTLRLVSADQQPRDLFNERVIDVTLEFDLPEFEGDHFELDRGLSKVIEPGDDDGSGGTYSSMDIPPNGMGPIQGAGGNPISDPIPFDGMGKFVEGFEPSKARWLRYKTKPSANFGALGIGVFT